MDADVFTYLMKFYWDTCTIVRALLFLLENLNFKQSH